MQPKIGGDTLSLHYKCIPESELTGSDITVRKWHIETEAYQVNHITLDFCKAFADFYVFVTPIVLKIEHFFFL